MAELGPMNWDFNVHTKIEATWFAICYVLERRKVGYKKNILLRLIIAACGEKSKFVYKHVSSYPNGEKA